MHPFHLLGVVGVFGGSLLCMVTSSLIMETTKMNLLLRVTNLVKKKGLIILRLLMINLVD